MKPSDNYNYMSKCPHCGSPFIMELDTKIKSKQTRDPWTDIIDLKEKLGIEKVLVCTNNKCRARFKPNEILIK